MPVEFCECCGQKIVRTRGHVKLMQLRIERGQTLEGVAAGAQISSSHLSRIERGLTNPSFTVAARLAAHYGIPIEDLMADFMATPAGPRH